MRMLDLEPPAAEKDIKAAYRDMAKVWHPDRFQGDPRLSAKAEEQFKRVQAAFQLLIAHLPIHAQVVAAPAEHVRPECGSACGSDRDVRAEQIRRVLAEFHDNKRFFVEPCIPTYLLHQIHSVYSDSSCTILGAVDTSMTRSGRTFVAFSPQRVVFKATGFSSSVQFAAYDALTPGNLGMVHGPYIEPDFFDRLAENIGLGKAYEGSALRVQLADKDLSDMLDNDGCRRLHSLLITLGNAAVLR